MKIKIDAATRKRLKLKKRAERAFRKLGKGSLTATQRASLKSVLAKGLREFPTRAEGRITPHLAPLGFRANIVTLGYIPDFSNETKHIAIEIDGSVHRTSECIERDAAKDQAFRKAGWTLLRFTNEQVFNDLANILSEVKRFC